MVRKRLGDLLREEAQKTPEPGTGEPHSSGETIEAIAVAVSTNGDEAQSAAIDPPESIDWQAIATHLKRDLQLTQQREHDLQQQLTEVQTREQQQSHQLVQRIEQLQTDLEQSQATIAQLKVEVRQLEQLKTDLETARHEILRLTQAPLHQPVVTTPAPPSPVRSGTSSTRLPATPKPTPATAPLVPRAYSRPGLKPISPHAVKPRTVLPRRPNLDIGWAD